MSTVWGTTKRLNTYVMPYVFSQKLRHSTWCQISFSLTKSTKLGTKRGGAPEDFWCLSLSRQRMMQKFCTIKIKFGKFLHHKPVTTTKTEKQFFSGSKMKLLVAFVSVALANNIQAGTGFAPGTSTRFDSKFFIDKFRWEEIFSISWNLSSLLRTIGFDENLWLRLLLLELRPEPTIRSHDWCLSSRWQR